MRRITILMLLTAVSLVAVGGASARVVQIKGLDFSGTFQSPFFTDACGTPVLVAVTATVNVTLVTDGDGTVVREVDTQPGGRLAFVAPATGRSFSFRAAAVLRFVYPEGGTIGAPALVYETGTIGNAPGIPADAGRQVWEGVVYDVSPEGIPLVEITGLLDDRGNREEGAVAAICAALT